MLKQQNSKTSNNIKTWKQIFKKKLKKTHVHKYTRLQLCY